MKIISTIIPLSSAISTLKEINVNLQISNDSLYNLAELGPQVIITQDTAKARKIMEDYPSIIWCAPELEYPGYDISTSYGFNLRNTLESKPIENLNIDISYINTHGEENKLFIKKLESLNKTLRIYGHAYGIYGMGHTNELSTPSIYKASKICAANNVVEIYKVLLLNKPCLTPYDFPYCHNVFDPNFDINKVAPVDGQIQIAVQNTFYDKFADIFQDIGMGHLSEQLLTIKGNILNEH